MVTDAALFFSREQAVTATALSTEVLKMGELKNFARGNPLYINLYLHTAFATGAETITVNLVAGDNATPDAGDKVLELLPATAVSALDEEGKLFRATFPEDMISGDDEYVAVHYTCSAGVTVGKFNAFCTLGGAND